LGDESVEIGVASVGGEESEGGEGVDGGAEFVGGSATAEVSAEGGAQDGGGGGGGNEAVVGTQSVRDLSPTLVEAEAVGDVGTEREVVVDAVDEAASAEEASGAEDEESASRRWGDGEGEGEDDGGRGGEGTRTRTLDEWAGDEFEFESMVAGFGYEDIQKMLSNGAAAAGMAEEAGLEEEEEEEEEEAEAIDVVGAPWDEEEETALSTNTSAFRATGPSADEGGQGTWAGVVAGEAVPGQVLGGAESGSGWTGVGGGDASGRGKKGLSEKFGDMEALRRVFGPYGFGGASGDEQAEPLNAVPLNEAGPNTLEWENKTYMNAVSEYYWNRPVADRPPRDPLPAFEGDDTAETLLENLHAKRQRFFDAAQPFKDDAFAFTNFMRKDFGLAPLVVVAPENQTRFDELNASLAAAVAAEDWVAAAEAEEEMELMTYMEDPDVDQDAEDEAWFQMERDKKEGRNWSTFEELLEIVDRENEEFIAKLAKLGEVYNNETGRFTLRRIPFVPTGGDEFDPALIGADLAISNQGKTVWRQFAGRPTYALWGQGGRVDGGAGNEEEVSRWKVRVDCNMGVMCVGVMELPFAPIEGLARRLATRAWFVDSAGEAMRTGPSTVPNAHEYVEKDNMTWMHEDTKVWEEGFTLNPKYRKPGCEMIVDPQSGETAWLESDRLRDEALSYQGPGMVAQLKDNIAMGLMLTMSPEMVECAAKRYLAIENRRFRASRANGWKNESFDDCLNRSLDDGFWEQVEKEHPVPDLEKLGYKNYRQAPAPRARAIVPVPCVRACPPADGCAPGSGDALDGLYEEAQALLTEEAIKVAAAWGLPEEYCYPPRELCSVQRLALLDVLKFGVRWFADLQTDGEPSEVRLEFDRRAGTLHVRVDNRPESFLFRNVSRDAKPFVNLCMHGDQVTLLDE